MSELVKKQKKKSKSKSIKRLPFVLGVLTTLSLMSIGYAMWKAPQVDPETLVERKSPRSMGNSDIVDPVSDHNKIINGNDPHVIYRYLTELNDWPRNEELPIKTDFQRRRISAANRLLEVDTTGEYVDAAIQSRLEAAEALYGMDFINEIDQPAVGQLLFKYAAPFVDSSNRKTAKMARMAMMKFEVFEYSRRVQNRTGQSGEQDNVLPQTAGEIKQRQAEQQSEREAQFAKVKTTLIDGIEQFPDDPKVTSLATTLMSRLVRDNEPATLAWMRDLHERFKDHESPVLVSFAKTMYDTALLRRYTYPRMIANRWVNGAISRKGIYDVTVRLLKDPNIGVTTLGHIQSAVDWYEQLNDTEKCDSLSNALLVASREINHPQAAKTAGTMSEKLRTRQAAIGQVLEFAHKTIEGREITHETLADKFVVVCFWSSQNRASNRVTRELKRIISGVQDQGVEIIAISIDMDYQEPCAKMVEENPRWNVVGGRPDDRAILKSFPISSIPHVMVIDRNGKVKFPNVAMGELQTRLEQLLAESDE